MEVTKVLSDGGLKYTSGVVTRIFILGWCASHAYTHSRICLRISIRITVALLRRNPKMLLHVCQPHSVIYYQRTSKNATKRNATDDCRRNVVVVVRSSSSALTLRSLAVRWRVRFTVIAALIIQRIQVCMYVCMDCTQPCHLP